ncbi:hypothetical protein CPB84DRAFT_1747085 [Gymnopilus junonius]|uniref:Uncharacterized protein n=1 Tax=Gymnopilus junonius TaxID=109634 RepID=A0A9P5NQ31_GYMJU|nr:hypothetical protein CPB84DRAFT_1747085 [Gymnopilus junonius]
MEEMNYSYELDNFEELRILLNSDYNSLNDLSSRSPYLPEIRSLPSCSQSSPLDYTSGPNTINYSWASSSTPSMSATQEGSDLFETYIQNTANGQTYVDNSWEYSMNQFLNNVSFYEQLSSSTEPTATAATVPAAPSLASFSTSLPDTSFTHSLPSTSFNHSLPATSFDSSLPYITQTSPNAGLYHQPSSSSSSTRLPASAQTQEECYAPIPSSSHGGKDASGGITSRRKARLSSKSACSSEKRRRPDTEKSTFPATYSTNQIFDALPTQPRLAEASMPPFSFLDDSVKSCSHNTNVVPEAKSKPSSSTHTFATDAKTTAPRVSSSSASKTLSGHSPVSVNEWKADGNRYAPSASSSMGGRDTNDGVSARRKARRVENNPLSKKQCKPPQKRTRQPALPITSGYAMTRTPNGKRFKLLCLHPDCQCSASFEGVDKLEAHVKSCHGVRGGKNKSDLVSCDWNNQRISVKQQQHLRTILQSLNITFQCTKCTVKDSRLDGIRRHCKDDHSDDEEHAVWDEVYMRL